MDGSHVCGHEETRALLAVNAVFEAFGRGLLCVDNDCRILHASTKAERLVGAAAAQLSGRSVAEILGEELFGCSGVVTLKLAAGVRSDAPLVPMRSADGDTQFVSVSIAPLHDANSLCDRTRALIVIAPVDEHEPHYRVELEPTDVNLLGRGVEREELRAVLDRFHWQRAETARALGISRTTLWRKMRDCGLI